MSSNENRSPSPLQVPSLPAHPTDQQFRAVLKDITLKYNELQSLYYQEKRQADSSLHTRSKKKRRPSTFDDTDTAAILSAGRHFSVMYLLWVDDDVFETEFDPDFEYTGDDIDDQSDRIICVARSLVPSRLLERQATTEMWATFMRGMSDMRSTAAHRVRECAPTILHCLPSDLDRREARENNPRWKQLLGYDAGKHTYSSLPPILYEQVLRPHRKEIFRSDILADVIRCILLGKASLRPQEHTKGHPKRATFAQLWGVKQVTPGLIAFAAILARWMISPDIHFDVAGAYSGSKYREDFVKYRRLIIAAINEPWMKKTIRLFNEALFPSAPDAQSTEQDSSPLDDFLDAVMSGARLSDSEDDEQLGDMYDGHDAGHSPVDLFAKEDSHEPDDDEPDEAAVRTVTVGRRDRAGTLRIEDEDMGPEVPLSGLPLTNDTATRMSQAEHSSQSETQDRPDRAGRRAQTVTIGDELEEQDPTSGLNTETQIAEVEQVGPSVMPGSQVKRRRRIADTSASQTQQNAHRRNPKRGL